MSFKQGMTNAENTNRIKKDEELEPELFNVAREKGTEIPYTGKYLQTKEKGMYRCAICDTELFSSDAKFNSGTGWPSFTEPANSEHITFAEDTREGMKRTEVLCKKCGAHLGHIFEDGPESRGGKRYCINSVCLALEENG